MSVAPRTSDRLAEKVARYESVAAEGHQSAEIDRGDFVRRPGSGRERVVASGKTVGCGNFFRNRYCPGIRRRKTIRRRGIIEPRHEPAPGFRFPERGQRPAPISRRSRRPWRPGRRTPPGPERRENARSEPPKFAVQPAAGRRVLGRRRRRGYEVQTGSISERNEDSRGVGADPSPALVAQFHGGKTGPRGKRRAPCRNDDHPARGYVGVLGVHGEVELADVQSGLGFSVGDRSAALRPTLPP